MLNRESEVWTCLNQRAMSYELREAQTKAQIKNSRKRDVLRSAPSLSQLSLLHISCVIFPAGELDGIEVTNKPYHSAWHLRPSRKTIGDVHPCSTAVRRRSGGLQRHLKSIRRRRSGILILADRLQRHTNQADNPALLDATHRGHCEPLSQSRTGPIPVARHVILFHHALIAMREGLGKRRRWRVSPNIPLLSLCFVRCRIRSCHRQNHYMLSLSLHPHISAPSLMVTSASTHLRTFRSSSRQRVPGKSRDTGIATAKDPAPDHFVSSPETVANYTKSQHSLFFAFI